MSLERLRQLPSRIRLAYRLLREYEYEEEPRSWEERMAMIHSFANAVNEGRLGIATRRVGAEAWKEAVLAKAPHFAAEPHGADLDSMGHV